MVQDGEPPRLRLKAQDAAHLHCFKVRSHLGVAEVGKKRVYEALYQQPLDVMEVHGKCLEEVMLKHGCSVEGVCDGCLIEESGSYLISYHVSRHFPSDGPHRALYLLDEIQ